MSIPTFEYPADYPGLQVNVHDDSDDSDRHSIQERDNGKRSQDTDLARCAVTPPADASQLGPAGNGNDAAIGSDMSTLRCCDASTRLQESERARYVHVRVVKCGPPLRA